MRDNIPVSLLARAYAKFAAETAAGTGKAKLNPSGYVESQGAFAERFAAAMRPRLGLACRLDLATQTDFSEPMMRVNTNSPPATSATGTRRPPGTRRRRGIEGSGPPGMRAARAADSEGRGEHAKLASTASHMNSGSFSRPLYNPATSAP